MQPAVNRQPGSPRENREAEEKHTLMLSAEGNSGAGARGRRLWLKRICNSEAVFSVFYVFLTQTFVLTNFSDFFMQKYIEWYPWFAWLCVLGEGKS